MEKLRKFWSIIILILLFIFFTSWWIYMNIALGKSNVLFGVFGNTYGIIAAWGGLCGLLISLKWGAWKSTMGRMIIFFSLGLLSQEFGQLAYSYYIFVRHIEIPYPSLGDIGFFSTIPFYIYGSLLLAKVSGVRIRLQSYLNKMWVIFVPALMFGIAYLLFLRQYPIDFQKPLETFLNFGYPMGQAIYISIAVLILSLSHKVLGGVMRGRVFFILLAFSAQFLADYLFIYFKDSYYPGSILDYLYVVAYFLMGVGIFRLQSVLDIL